MQMVRKSYRYNSRRPSGLWLQENESPIPHVIPAQKGGNEGQTAQTTANNKAALNFAECCKAHFIKY